MILIQDQETDQCQQLRFAMTVEKDGIIDTSLKASIPIQKHCIS